jgi:hypothetical protein
MNRWLKFICKRLIIVVVLLFYLIIPIANADSLVNREINPKEVMKLGVEKLQISDYSGAIGRFSQAIEINPKYSGA